MIKVEVDSVKRALKITVSGMVKVDEAENYLKELQSTINRIDASKYALIIDAREQKTLTPDTIATLEKALKIYTETPFVKRFAVVLESVVAMQQIKRVGKEDVDDFVMVTSVEEAYRSL